ncbi:MAG TPA: sigma-54 dependent transcriptional regulator [Candidatus Binatia bacterium]|jgi:DNA-binding NtrC family response regulator|nr:sigma-54 dependent transcriptional regulator [Candidatus Binatia bacterium]
MTPAVPEPSIKPARILVVDDDRAMCQLLIDLLREDGYQADVAYDGESALEKCRTTRFDLAITDLMMPKMRGIELVQRLREIDASALVLLITAFGTIESAVEAMRAGAFHYVTKPFHNDEILIQVKRALEQKTLQEELKRLRAEVQARNRFQNIIGQSSAMQSVFETIAQVSDLPANILIEGESGTGKELIARAIHSNSSRATGPFIPVNCAAIPETLLESELFGYVRGAFTDARRDRPGLFREASGGILFLDEISEIPITLQAKLLRVLEDKEVRPLGANQSEKVDTRVLSASNRYLDELVRNGKFRQDLYYRLNVIRIELPALRHRSEDIPLLVKHFIDKFADSAKRSVEGIQDEALAALKSYDWPGNIRELEHTIERAVLLGKGALVGVEDLPGHLVACGDSAFVLAQALAKQFTLRDLEREYIGKVLETTRGNKTEAARILGVDRTTLYRKLEEYKFKD